ncbi:MAG: hypothetical protein JWN17_3236 [Frankiales bacterium]|nr:hypothetical protein [Frankiales bacterium]
MRVPHRLLCALPLVAVPAAVALCPTLATAASPTPWSVRINAGGPALTDSSGRTWLSDRYYVGGTAAAFTAPTRNTPDTKPYLDERYGMTGYKIPVPAPGIYQLTLRMAEGWATQPGIRVFSATAEGQTIVSDLDLVKVIGTTTAYDVTVPVRTTDSVLDLGFSATADNATVAGIEVTAVDPTSAVAPPASAPATTSPSPAPVVQPTTPATTPPPSPAPTTPAPTNPWPVTGTSSLYVSPTGSDSGSGTQASPFRSISRAADAASPGTVVHVAPGSYGYVESTRSGTSGAPITFVSDTRWGAKITAPGMTNAWTNTGEYVVIQGFDLSGSRYSGIMSTGSYGKFLGNHIHNMVPPDCSRGGAGIELQNYSGTHNDSIGNVVHDIMAPTSDCGLIHGIYYQGPDGGRVVNNLVYRTSGWGIHLWHNANHVVIANNTVFQNKQGGMVIGGSLEGNDISPGVDNGTVVTNNVVVDNGYWGIREMGRVGVNTYANNLLSDNASGGYDLNGGGVPTGTVNADPRFVNAAGGDYHLSTLSPAIDAGTSQGALGYDLDLRPRPQGLRQDIGAYEGGH